jgi:hypothetical protein
MTGCIDGNWQLRCDPVQQFPGVPSQIPLQLSLAVDYKLGCRIHDASTFTLVLVVPAGRCA